MPTETTETPDKVQQIKTLLPSLVQSINNDERLPWATGITVEDIKVSRIPILFVSGDFAHAASRRAAGYAAGKPVHAGNIGTRLVITQAPDSQKPLLADLTFHDKANGTIGIASIEFTTDGELVKVNASDVYTDGSKLGRNYRSYVASLLTVFLLNASKEPASGVTCTVIDGIEFYEYNEGLDSDLEHEHATVQYSPRIMPRLRDELAKELVHLPARTGMGANEVTRRYFKEIAESIADTNEMWWVSEDMSTLAWDVAMSGTEPEDLDERELPTPSGIMWLNGGGGPALLTKHLPDAQFFETADTPSELLSINAIVWYTPTEKSSGISGLEIGKPRFMGLTASPGIARDSTQWNAILSPLDLESNLIDYFRVPTYATFFKLKFLPRKLALIVMRLAREESLGEKRLETTGGEAKGNVRKRAKNKKIETITCALLRRSEYASDSEREAEAREYSHRWIVRGHMRNQAVGPRNAQGGQQHERVWIAPYVKGPEDKPLVLKDRVQVWR